MMDQIQGSQDYLHGEGGADIDRTLMMVASGIVDKTKDEVSCRAL